jgi:hypothetical protein
MAYKYSGRIIRAGKAWTDNDGIQHPSNWMLWDAATKAARGLVWEDDPANFDGRFYWSAGVAKALDDVNEVDEDGNAINWMPMATDSHAWPQVKRYCFVKAQAGGLLPLLTGWLSKHLRLQIIHCRNAAISCRSTHSQQQYRSSHHSG